MYTMHRRPLPDPGTAVLITRPVYTALVEQSRASVPREACGLLIGGSMTDVFGMMLLDNTSSDPETTFEFNPLRAFGVLDEWRERDGFRGDAVGVWHSHPRAEPVPSTTDLAYVRGTVLHVIVGLTPTVDVRAYVIADGVLVSTHPVAPVDAEPGS